MTFYKHKLTRLHSTIYKNQAQIDAIRAVRNYIDANYETDLNMDLLSKIQLISKYHLIRLFKKYYGLTPRQYLIDKRIEKSKEQLAKGISVTKTCYSVGFTSLGSFSALFKTKTGKSPVQFQKEQLSRNKLICDTSSLGWKNLNQPKNESNTYQYPGQGSGKGIQILHRKAGIH